jgi:hypothetical protein
MGLMRVLGMERKERRGAQVAEVEGDHGGGYLRTGDQALAPGDDANPLPGDYAVTIPGVGSGSEHVVGCIDPVNGGETEPGGRRIYARDDGGAVVASVHLEPDGTATIENDGGTLTLTPDGDVEASGDLTVEGDIKAGGDIVADKDGTAISLLNHTHIGNLGSSTSPPEP